MSTSFFHIRLYLLKIHSSSHTYYTYLQYIYNLSLFCRRAAVVADLTHTVKDAWFADCLPARLSRNWVWKKVTWLACYCRIYQSTFSPFTGPLKPGLSLHSSIRFTLPVRRRHNCIPSPTGYIMLNEVSSKRPTKLLMWFYFSGGETTVWERRSEIVHDHFFIAPRDTRSIA